jgi:hypothetical protein
MYNCSITNICDNLIKVCGETLCDCLKSNFEYCSGYSIQFPIVIFVIFWISLCALMTACYMCKIKILKRMHSRPNDEETPLSNNVSHKEFFNEKTNPSLPEEV